MVKRRKNFVTAFGSRRRLRTIVGHKPERRQAHSLLDQERWDELPVQKTMRQENRRNWRVTYEAPVLNAINQYRGRSLDEFWSYLNQHIDQRTERYDDLRRVVKSILRLDDETVFWVEGEPYVKSYRFGGPARKLNDLKERRHRFYIHPERKTIEFWPYDAPKPKAPKFVNSIAFEGWVYERLENGTWRRVIPPPPPTYCWQEAELMLPTYQNVSRRTAKKVERLWKKKNQRALEILESQRLAVEPT